MSAGNLVSSTVSTDDLPELMRTYTARTVSTEVSPHHNINLQRMIWYDVELGQRTVTRSQFDGAKWSENTTQLDRPTLNQSFTIDTSRSTCQETPFSSYVAFGLETLKNATLLGFETVNELNCSHWQSQEQSMLQVLTTDMFLHQLQQGPEKGRWKVVRVDVVWTDGAGSYPSTTNWSDVQSLIGVSGASHAFDVPLECSANITCNRASDCPDDSICCGNGFCATDARQGCRCVEGCTGATTCCDRGRDVGFCRHFCSPSPVSL